MSLKSLNQFCLLENFLYSDEYLFAIDKPEGHFVHPPEESKYRVSRDRICLLALEKSLQRRVYPIHRLDAPTSGIVLFAYSRETTRQLSAQFMNRLVKKTYLAVARGHLPDEGVINLPLEVKGFDQKMESETNYKCLSRLELPRAVGKKYPSARYSLLLINPITGRWHQIRRHFDRISHPLLGDIEHGDSHHNRFFRDELGIKGLCLRALQLEINHPLNGQRLVIRAGEPEKWRLIRELFKVDKSVFDSSIGLI